MSKKDKAAKEYLRLGLDMLRAGDIETAVKALRVASSDLPRNQDARLALAQALRQQGDIGEAVVVLTQALALPPASEVGGRMLSVLLQRYTLDDVADLDPAGLRAALALADIDRQPIVRTAFAWLKQAGVLRDAVAKGRAEGWDAAAVDVFADRKSSVARNELFCQALGAGFNTDPDIERFLTALRRHLLLEVSDEDLLRNKANFQLALGLAAQADLNERVWSASADEAAARAALVPDAEKLARGDAEAAPALVRQLLYLPVDATAIGAWSAEQVTRLRPRALAGLLEPVFLAREEERRIAAALVRYNEIQDATSKRVAGQYEKSPYPRWTSLNVDAPAIRLGELERVFGAPVAERFREEPFDVLVAGCGTGHHAAQIAVAYGSNAKLLGVDLSRGSLAYAQRMASRFELANLSFAQVDLLDAQAIGRQFDVIECIGVLHHMADPLAGWRSVLRLLKPDGLMYVGLYSAVARKALAALRTSPEYPGPGCDDDTARAYRATLFDKLPGDGSTPLSASQDFYTLSDFRDLVLHESEQHLTLEQIGRFLEDEGLAFCGFGLDSQTLRRFERAFPDDAMPGTLENWAQFEREHPKTFEGMYNFWCQRKP